jgi:hypothetical protein
MAGLLIIFLNKLLTLFQKQPNKLFIDPRTQSRNIKKNKERIQKRFLDGYKHKHTRDR